MPWDNEEDWKAVAEALSAEKKEREAEHEKRIQDLIKFYEDRIDHLDTMLERSMEMNKTLINKIGSE
jgi:Mg2+ and Co2+ transporter CorA